MPVVHGSKLPTNEEVLDVSGQLERVAVGDNEVGEFALLESSDLIVKAENARGINGDGFEGFLVRQTVRDGVCSVLSQPPRKGIIEAGEGKLHARSGKLGGLRQHAIVRIVFLR